MQTNRVDGDNKMKKKVITVISTVILIGSTLTNAQSVGTSGDMVSGNDTYCELVREQIAQELFELKNKQRKSTALSQTYSQKIKTDFEKVIARHFNSLPDDLREKVQKYKTTFLKLQSSNLDENTKKDAIEKTNRFFNRIISLSGSLLNHELVKAYNKIMDQAAGVFKLYTAAELSPYMNPKDGKIIVNFENSYSYNDISFRPELSIDLETGEVFIETKRSPYSSLIEDMEKGVISYAGNEHSILPSYCNETVENNTIDPSAINGRQSKLIDAATIGTGSVNTPAPIQTARLITE